MENNIPKENKKGKSKKFYIISIIVSLLLVAVIIGTSYAYFSASVDNSNNEATVIKTGYMEIEFTDGEIIGTTNDMVPGDSIIKKFKVRNTGNVTTPYDVYFSEVVNTFTNKSDLVYTLRTGDNNYNKENIVAPSEPGKLVDQRKIEPGEEQEYELEITFKETGINQDNNKGKKFRTKISINEYDYAKVIVEYNAKGGEVSTNDIEIDYGATIATLPEPTREGYDFAGWYSEETGGEQITNETEFTASTTLYAHWSVTNYTISYTDASGAVNPSNYTIETEDITLNNPTSSKSYCTFIGWSGSELTGTDNTNVVIEKGSTGNKTYTANWSVDSSQGEVVAGDNNWYGVYKNGNLSECWFGDPNNGGTKCTFAGNVHFEAMVTCTGAGNVTSPSRAGLCNPELPDDYSGYPVGNLPKTRNALTCP